MRRAQLVPFFIACALTTPAAAEYPDHPIRMVVPQAAGSSTDTVTRVLAAARPRSHRKIAAGWVHVVHGSDRRARHYSASGRAAAL